MIDWKKYESVRDKLNILLKDTDYYNGRKVIDNTDIYGEHPKIAIVTENRGAGKTSYWQLFMIELFRQHHYQSVIYYRYGYELKAGIEEFTDIASCYYPDMEMSEEIIMDSGISAYKIGDEVFCYGICLKKANPIKRKSSMFRNVEFGFLDEYQPEDGKFLRKEVELFMSVLLTVGRGNKKQSRSFLNVISGNPVTLLNPYLINWGVHTRYRYMKDTIRLNGVVAIFNINPAAKEQLEEGFGSLLSEKTRKYTVGEEFLVDARKNMFIKAPNKCVYRFTLNYEDLQIGVRYEPKTGNVYCNENVDRSCTRVFTIHPQNVSETEHLLVRACYSFSMLKDAYIKGRLKYSSEKILNAVIDILGIDFMK